MKYHSVNLESTTREVNPQELTRSAVRFANLVKDTLPVKLSISMSLKSNFCGLNWTDKTMAIAKIKATIIEAWGHVMLDKKVIIVLQSIAEFLIERMLGGFCCSKTNTFHTFCVLLVPA